MHNNPLLNLSNPMDDDHWTQTCNQARATHAGKTLIFVHIAV